MAQIKIKGDQHAAESRGMMTYSPTVMSEASAANADIGFTQSLSSRGVYSIKLYDQAGNLIKSKIIENERDGKVVLKAVEVGQEGEEIGGETNTVFTWKVSSESFGAGSRVELAKYGKIDGSCELKALAVNLSPFSQTSAFRASISGNGTVEFSIPFEVL